MHDDMDASMWLAHHQAFGDWVAGAFAALKPGRRNGGTLLLARRDIARLMNQAEWLEAVERGFRAAAGGKASSPPPMEIAGRGGTFHAKGASIDLDRRYIALKLNGNFPGNPALRHLPTIQGAILLCDGETGALLAVMDSIEVTLRRTAAATALAARYLARKESQTVLICGCGEQGRAQLAALQAVLPVKRWLSWDRDADRAKRFTHETGAEAIAGPGDGAGLDVIVTCTTASEPFLARANVAPGTFVAAVGADSRTSRKSHRICLTRRWSSPTCSINVRRWATSITR